MSVLNKKCNRKEKCWVADKFIHETVIDKKLGLFKKKYWDIEKDTQTLTLLFLGYKEEGKKKEVLLNFCPFCGANQEELIKEAK